MIGQVEGTSTLNFKIIRQGHVIYRNIFEFYDFNYVENNTNVIALSHLRTSKDMLINKQW